MTSPICQMAAGQPPADYLRRRSLSRHCAVHCVACLARSGRTLACTARHERRPRGARRRRAPAPNRQGRASRAARQLLSRRIRRSAGFASTCAIPITRSRADRRFFRSRGRALLHRASGSALDAHTAHGGLRPERRVAVVGAAVWLGHVAAGGWPDARPRLYAAGRGRCRHVLRARPLPRSGRARGKTAGPAEVPTFRGSWENTAFLTLLRNAIAWSTTESARARAATASA